MYNHQKVGVATLVVAACFLFVGSLPVWAGRWELRYTPNAAISIKMVGDRIVGIVNPTFGPGRAGEIELRLAGVPFVKLAAPPYEFGIDPTRPIAPLAGDEYRGFGSVSIHNDLDYTIEAYVVEKGNRKQSAAPALTFRLEESNTDETTVAGPSEIQLRELLKKAYDEGFRQGQGAATSAPTSKVTVRLWDETGFPVSGRVGLRLEREAVNGQVVEYLPPGSVSVQVFSVPGFIWELASGQTAAMKVFPDQEVVWNLYKKGGRK